MMASTEAGDGNHMPPSEVTFDDSAMAIVQDDSMASQDMAAEEQSNESSSSTVLMKGDADSDISRRGEDAKEDATMKKDSDVVATRDDEKEVEIRKKVRDTFLYVETSEDTLKQPKLFLKTFAKGGVGDDDAVWNDWTNNHYLQNDMKTGSGTQAFLTSYDFQRDDPATRQFLGWPATSADDVSERGENRGCWLRIPRPSSMREEPTVPRDDISVLSRYLRHIKSNDPGRFRHCSEDMNDMIPLLTLNDIPEKEFDGKEKVGAFIRSAVEYVASSQFTAFASVYEKFHAHRQDRTTELLVGFGHVRMLYSTGTNEQRLVNGPLFEVSCDVTFEQGENGAAEIRPTKDAAITLNADVMAALNKAGTSNSVFIERLTDLEQLTKVASLRLDAPESYRKLLEAAVVMCCRGKLMSADQSSVHVTPSDPDALLITDGYCLFSRKKLSNVFSRDARKLIEAMDRNNLEITEPIRALVCGPSYLEATSGKTMNNCNKKICIDDLVYTLPASEKQREVGERLLVGGEPVVALEGPPGTGKTHTIVNVATTAISVGKSVLVTSSNATALRAFYEKIPEVLRSLVLDVACVVEGGTTKLQEALQTLLYTLKQKTIKSNKRNKLIGQITELKNILRSKVQQAKEMSNVKRCILEDGKCGDVLFLAQNLSDSAMRLAKAVLSDEAGIDIESIKAGLRGLKQFQCDAEIISFVEDGTTSVSDDEVFLKLLEDKAAGTYEFNPESEEKLSSVRIGDRGPQTLEDWRRIHTFLKTRANCIAPLIKCGYTEMEISGEELSSLIELVETAAEAKKSIDALSLPGVELKDALRSIMMDDISFGSQMQEECRKLVLEIEAKEGELLFEKVVAAMNKKLDAEARSALTALEDDLEKNPSAMEATSTGERATRCREELKSSFKKAAEHMPLIVMTTEQVSELLPAEHNFDLAIMDETSQSNCTATTIMARSKQLLAVGDDKQVSPSNVGLGEDRIRWLERKLPPIPTKGKLLPESSFFALVKSTFPYSSVAMFEHYRCDPRIIQISNASFYAGRLLPMRLASHEPAVVDIAVYGERYGGKKQSKKQKNSKNGSEGKEKTTIAKTNTKEAETIATYIADYIRENARSEEYETIGVISLGGQEQCKLLQNMIEANNESLIVDLGADVVDRHQIRIGTPQQFQGDERDIVLLSLVASSIIKGERKKLPRDTSSAQHKAWNVALTRAKNKIVICRSYGIQDLHPRDFRQKIFRMFMGRDGIPAPKPRKRENVLDSIESNLTKRLAHQGYSKLSEKLKLEGYQIRKQGGKVWSNAICVDSCALVLIVNHGETEEDWETAKDQQQSLESAGRSCLCVDYFALTLNFPAAFKDVLVFLRKSGLTPATPPAAAMAGNKRNTADDVSLKDSMAKRSKKSRTD